MGFAKQLQNLFDRSNFLFEATAATVKKGIDTASIKKIIDSEVGGSIGEKSDVISSFDGLEKALELIPLDSLESSTTENGEIFNDLVKKDKIDFLEEFTKREADSLSATVNTINSIDADKDEIKYISLINKYARVSERLLKINKLLSLYSEVSEAVSQVLPEIKNKINTIIRLSKVKVVDGFNKIVKSEEKRIAALPDNQEGADKFNTYREILDILGLSGILSNQIQKKEEKIVKIQNPSTKTKERIITRLVRSISMAQLPAVTNGKIEINGDYFKLFKSLDQKNKAWMDLSLSKYVFRGETTRFNEFNTVARENESISESDQLVYLSANKSWILSYIKGEQDGILTDKAENNYVTQLENVTLEKDKEIKNYYLSRDFNLSNLGGLQLKPEIRLPLYVKVKLPVTEADRVKESPLSNIIKGLGQIVTGLFSAIPDTGDKAFAQASKNRNMAVLNGISSLIRGGVTLVGGKQAGREYDKKITGLTQNKEKGGVKEDMISVADAPGFVAVNPEQPGQLMQTPDSLVSDMDILSLAGPQRPIKKSKKKKSKKSNSVKTFSDFMGRK